MPSASSSSRCYCPASNSVDGASCVAFGDVSDSVVLPTDESCYDEVVEATGSDTCEFIESPEKSCQKRGKCTVMERYPILSELMRIDILFRIMEFVGFIDNHINPLKIM